jgi:hypothetical protein
MAIESGVGVSTNDDLVAAVREAALAARKECASPSTALVFVNYTYPHDQLAAASRAASEIFPAGTTVAGGTVMGVVYEGVRHDANHGARAVMVLALGGTASIGVALAAQSGDDPASAGRALAEDARARVDAPHRGGMLFCAGLSNGIDVTDIRLLDGLLPVLPGVRLSGCGLAGDMDVSGSPQPGFAFLGDRVERLGTLLVLLGGTARVGASIANGMELDKSVGKVTDAQGFAVRAIDGQPARDVLLQRIAKPEGPDAGDQLCKAPLMFFTERESCIAVLDAKGGMYWGHNPIAFTPDGAFLDFFRAPAGTELFMTHLTPEGCMNAVNRAVEMLVKDAEVEEFDLVMSFSCAMRGITLGAEAVHEDRRLREAVRAKKHLGLVASGEIGCYGTNDPCMTGWVYSLLGLTAPA